MNAEFQVPYFTRSLRPILDEALSDTRVVAILGPRECGKSTFAMRHDDGRAYITLDDDTVLKTVLKTVLNDPVGFVKALPQKVTIDEIQHALPLIRAIKMAVDRNQRPGRFILTGSANLLTLPKLAESLAGRMEIINLNPFTESEKEQLPGAFLEHLVEGKLKREVVGQSDESPPDELPRRIIAGGFPEVLRRSPASAARWHRNYLTTLVERDMRDVADIRDTGEVTKLLELLSHRTAALLNVTNLSRDLKADRATVEKYLGILERLFLVRMLRPWSVNEGKRLIKTPKMHFIDSGLAASLSKLKLAHWNSKREAFGHLLESFVVQQIIAQAQWTDPSLRFSHYRDKDQVEVDLVIESGRDVWGVEVKASESVTEKDGAGLRRLAKLAGKNFRGGYLLYNGSMTWPLPGNERFMAVPLSKFWTM